MQAVGHMPDLSRFLYYWLTCKGRQVIHNGFAHRKSYVSSHAARRLAGHKGLWSEAVRLVRAFPPGIAARSQW